jgi:predicted porin
MTGKNNNRRRTMKKQIIVAAALSASAGIASAQSSVTVYGLIDAALSHTTNANAAGDAVTRMPTVAGEHGSRLGFRGAEDLGNGTQAIFVLESGFGPDDGTSAQGKRLFGRQAYVGLAGPYGTLTFGRVYTMTNVAILKSDLLGTNLFGVGSLDATIPNARSDNTVAYLGSWAGFTVGATYSTGRDTSAAGGPGGTNCPGEVPGNARACRETSVLLGYERGTSGITTSYDIMYGNAGAGNGLTSSALYDRHTTLSGYATLLGTRLGAGIIARSTRAATGAVDSNLYYLQASRFLTPALQFDVAAARLDVRHSPNDATMGVLRLTYFLSKRSAVYSAVGRMLNGGRSAVSLDAGGSIGAGLNQNGLMAGLKHFF